MTNRGFRIVSIGFWVAIAVGMAAVFGIWPQMEKYHLWFAGGIAVLATIFLVVTRRFREPPPP